MDLHFCHKTINFGIRKTVLFDDYWPY